MTDFGPIKFLTDSLIIPFLSFSYQTIFPNYGFAIILLTVIIKLLFFPLMNKQYASMKKMQDIAPKMKELREKFKTQPQKMQEAVLKLYRENNVNPLSGCLPMLLQIPFFIAIYATIMSNKFTALLVEPGINKGLFSFWLADLALPDATFILPVVLAVFTFYSQKMMMVDPKQKQFLFLSPVIILVFGLKLPAGILLYWAASTVLSTVQQFYVNSQQSATSGTTVEVIKNKA